MKPEDIFRVNGKVAVVTGASSGLGERFARVLHANGAHVVCVARRAERLDALVAELDSDEARVVAVSADITEVAQCRRVAESAREAFGRVDILVNNAGLGHAAPASRETEEDFRSVVDINLNATFWMAQACQPLMPEGSSIINIASVLGHKAPPFPQAAYTASKAGVLGLTRNLAQEWSGRKGIRINAISPGYFRTEMTDEDGEQLERMVADHSIMGRTGDPKELDGALLFLASPASSYVTGTDILVDGGLAAV